MSENYYCVYNWMVKELGLRGNEKDVFAVIYSFTGSCGEFTGSLTYLSETTGAAKSTVAASLSGLVKKGVLLKRDYLKNGVRCCAYKSLRAAKDGPEAYRNPEYPVPETGRGHTENQTEAYRKPAYPVPETGRGYTENQTETYRKPEGGVPKTGTNNKEDNIIHTTEDKTEGNTPAPVKILRHKYGEYGNVLLSDGELDKLRREFPEDWRKRIDRLSEYMASTGKHYRDHLATIRLWAKRDAPAEKPKGRFADLKGGLVL